MISIWELMFLVGCLICAYNPLLLLFEIFDFYNLLVFGFLGVVSNLFTIFFFFFMFIYILWSSYLNFFKEDLLYNLYSEYFIFICLYLVTLLFLLYLIMVVKNNMDILVHNLLISIFLVSNFFYFYVEDYFLFYIVLEFQTMILYIFYNITLVYASYYIRGGIRFFILSIFMSLVLLLGISFVYIGSGTLVIDEIALIDMFYLHLFRLNFNYIVYKIGLVLIYSVFLFKLGLFPFYVWMLEIFVFVKSFYFILYILMSKISLYFFFIKIIISSGYLFFLSIIFIFSIIVGVLNLYREDDLRKFIIYSSMVQFGILCLCLFSLNYFIGMAILCLYFNYVVVFISLYFLCSKVYGVFSSILCLNGLGKIYKLFVVIFSIFLLSVIGVPPLLGFIGKLYLFFGFLVDGNFCLCLFILIVSILSSIYYFNLIRYLIFGELVNNNIYIYSYSFISSFFVYIVGILFMITFLFFNINAF